MRLLRHRWGRAAVLLAVLASASILLLASRGESIRPEPRIYWGAFIGPHLTGLEAPWDMDAVSAFEGIVRKPLSLVNFGMPFADCAEYPCRYHEFPTAALEDIRRYGAIPILSWASHSTPANREQPDFGLSELIEGRYDSHIRAFALAAKAWGRPFFLRFDHQMNSEGYAWAEGVNGNAPGEFVRAWRHVHDTFTRVGATNVTWIWCPAATPRTEDLAGLYPGDTYVDWTCLDAYNFGPFGGDDWLTFDELFEPAYTEITARVAPAKPMLIGEVASSEYGGLKPDWIDEMLETLPVDYPLIRGVVYFEKFGVEMDWPIETSALSVDAFARAISDPVYAGNDYAGIDTTPIPPPG